MFGHDEKGIADLWQNGYDPKHHMSSELWDVINLIKGGHFSHGDKEMFEPLINNLLYHDPFCVFADFSDYLDAQDRVSRAWTNGKDGIECLLLTQHDLVSFLQTDQSETTVPKFGGYEIYF